MYAAILARYGFGYDASRSAQPLLNRDGELLYPPPKPLYVGNVDTDAMVREHGEWCLARMLGRNARNAAIPAESEAGYIAREQHVLAVMEA